MDTVEVYVGLTVASNETVVALQCPSAASLAA
jgi:hypothetical protein